jgi:hypothetical protein
MLTLQADMGDLYISYNIHQYTSHQCQFLKYQNICQKIKMVSLPTT